MTSLIFGGGSGSLAGTTDFAVAFGSVSLVGFNGGSEPDISVILNEGVAAFPTTKWGWTGLGCLCFCQLKFQVDQESLRVSTLPRGMIVEMQGRSMKCANCSALVSFGARFCPHCGSTIRGAAELPVPAGLSKTGRRLPFGLKVLNGNFLSGALLAAILIACGIVLLLIINNAISDNQPSPLPSEVPVSKPITGAPEAFGGPIDSTELSRRGEAVYARINSRYRFPIDVGSTFFSNLDRYTVCLEVPKGDWQKLSKDEQVSLLLYAESLIAKVRENPEHFVKAWKLYAGWDDEIGRAVGNIGRICDSCWAIALGKPVKVGGKFEFEEESRIDQNKAQEIRIHGTADTTEYESGQRGTEQTEEARLLADEEHLAKARELLKTELPNSYDDLEAARKHIESVSEIRRKQKQAVLLLLKKRYRAAIKEESERGIAMDRAFCRNPLAECEETIAPLLRKMLHDPNALESFKVIGCLPKYGAPGMIKVMISYSFRDESNLIIQRKQGFVIFRSSSGTQVVPVKD